MIKSGLLFPLAYLVRKALLFCCIIRALKCGSHPLAREDPFLWDG